MKKWNRHVVLALALGLGIAGVVGLSSPTALGQGKDKEKVKEAKTTDVKKAEPPKPVEAKGSVVITKDKQMKYRFQVRDADDKVVMQCVKGYETEKDAIKAFEDALAIAKVAKPTLEK